MKPSQHSINGDIESIFTAPIFTTAVHKLWYQTNHLLSHPSHFISAVPLQHFPDRRPVPHISPVYKNREFLRFITQKPLILIVNASFPKENRYGAGQHAVERRSSRVGIASRLQAEIRRQERLKNLRRAVVAPSSRAVNDSARVGLVVAVAL